LLLKPTVVLAEEEVIVYGYSTVKGNDWITAYRLRQQQDSMANAERQRARAEQAAREAAAEEKQSQFRSCMGSAQGGESG